MKWRQVICSCMIMLFFLTGLSLAKEEKLFMWDSSQEIDWEKLASRGEHWLQIGDAGEVKLYLAFPSIIGLDYRVNKGNKKLTDLISHEVVVKISRKNVDEILILDMNYQNRTGRVKRIYQIAKGKGLEIKVDLPDEWASEEEDPMVKTVLKNSVYYATDVQGRTERSWKINDQLSQKYLAMTDKKSDLVRVNYVEEASQFFYYIPALNGMIENPDQKIHELLFKLVRKDGRAIISKYDVDFKEQRIREYVSVDIIKNFEGKNIEMQHANYSDMTWYPKESSFYSLNEELQKYWKKNAYYWFKEIKEEKVWHFLALASDGSQTFLHKEKFEESFWRYKNQQESHIEAILYIRGSSGDIYVTKVLIDLLNQTVTVNGELKKEGEDFWDLSISKQTWKKEEAPIFFQPIYKMVEDMVNE